MTTRTIPAGPSELTAEWLTEALRERGLLGDASVASFTLQDVGAGVGLLGQLARVTLTYDGPAPDAPPTLVAKFPTMDEGGRGLCIALRIYEREVRFYDELARDVQLRVPACYYSAINAATGEFVLLLEDMAPARMGDQLVSVSVPDAELCVRELARFHAAWWDTARMHELEWIPLASDPVNLFVEPVYQQSWPPFLATLGANLPQEMKELGERMNTRITKLFHGFDDLPRTIVHGDFRADNLFFGDDTGRPPLAVLDWQICVRSTGTYDLAYFMSQSLDVPTRRAVEDRLLHLYHDTLAEQGVSGYSFEQCLLDYRRSVLFCWVYPVVAIGTIAAANERGRDLTIAMMERSAAAIMDHNAAELLPD